MHRHCWKLRLCKHSETIVIRFWQPSGISPLPLFTLRVSYWSPLKVCHISPHAGLMHPFERGFSFELEILCWVQG